MARARSAHAARMQRAYSEHAARAQRTASERQQSDNCAYKKMPACLACSHIEVEKRRDIP